MKVLIAIGGGTIGGAGLRSPTQVNKYHYNIAFNVLASLYTGL